MERDLREMLDRQAAWQRARAAKSWADKLRTAVIMRRALSAIRKPAADHSIPIPRPASVARTPK
jgi:hypothetical protein